MPQAKGRFAEEASVVRDEASRLQYEHTHVCIQCQRMLLTENVSLCASMNKGFDR